MRMLHLCYENGYEPATYAAFGSDTSVMDFDIVLWDPKEVISEYLFDPHDDHFVRSSHYRGLPSLGASGSARILADTRRRKQELSDFIKLGRTLFVIVRSPQDFYYDTGKREYSGTGKNRQTTTIVNDASVGVALPVAVSMVAASGNRIEFCGPDGPFATFWRDQKAVLRYDAYLEGEYGTPLWKVAGTDRVLGSFARVQEGGLIVFLPAAVFPKPGTKKKGAETDDKPFAFQQALLELAGALQADGFESTLPDWSNEYLLPGEQQQIEEAQARELEVQEARSRTQEASARLRMLQTDKLLFTGSGRPLELRVRDVLEALEGEVLEPEPGRDDWIVHFPERSAVVEVKGVSGSAAEKHAAQLEKWVSGYIEEHGTTPKGLLVVNGWRDTPLEERTEPVFPDQMLNYSEARDHCLVTGLQMLGVLCDLRSGGKTAQEIRDQLLSTRGVFQAYEDYKTFLSLVEPLDTEEERQSPDVTEDEAQS